MTTKIIYAVAIIVLLMPIPSYSFQCVWTQGKGEVVLENFTPAEAKNIALRQARHAAIEKATGVQITAVTLVKDFSFVGEFVKSLTKGYITEEKVAKWEQDKYQPDEKDFPIIILRVIIDACVTPAKHLSDKGFRLKTTINKSVFNEGEKAILEVTSTKKAFINIFNLSADNRVLYYHQPPQIKMPLPIEAGEKVTFPSKGISLEMSVPDTFNRATEAFIIVATLENINLPLILNGKTDLSLAEFYNGILSIEGDSVDDIVVYNVEKRR